MTRYNIILGKIPPVDIILSTQELNCEISFPEIIWGTAVGIGGRVVIMNRFPHSLIHEIARKKVFPEDMWYVDSTGKNSSIVTNTIDILCCFTEIEAIGELNEIGIIDNSGKLLTYRTFAPVNKTNTMSLTFHNRLQF